MSIISNLISGLSIGSIYALIALGYTLVYGIAKMLNFAHGDVIMVGAFSIIVATNMSMPPIISIIIAVAICTILGMAIEKIAYKPLRKQSPLTVLITAIGVSYLLQSLALLIFGSAKQSFPNILNLQPITITDGLVIQGASLVTLVVTIAIMIGLTLFINKTKIGRAMLAVSEDKGAAQLMGVNVNRTISITFAIGSALAAIAGLFYGQSYDFIGPYTGSMPGIKAFVAAVLGGIGSVPGAMVGGLVLGILESLAKAFNMGELADAIVFGVLIVVLVIKPTGLFGKKISEKV